MRSMPTLGACLLLAAATATPATAARADDGDDDAAASAPPRPRWHLQLKRQNTGRGTPGESTKTTLRFEHLPDGPLALVRVELPFPDEETSTSGSPFNPRPGDLLVRLGFRAVRSGDLPWSPFTELTFPTADPSSLGAGSLRLTLGVFTGARFDTAPAWQALWAAQVQQTTALALEDGASDVNYTKFEFALAGVWERDRSLKATLKPVVDWVQDGKVGAVLEIEGALDLAPGWRFSLMGGFRAWGPSVASTYDKRLELNLGYRF